MRPLTLTLATSLLMPTTAVAQSLDLTDDSAQPRSELEHTTPVDQPDLEGFEGQAGSKLLLP